VANISVTFTPPTSTDPAIFEASPKSFRVDDAGISTITIELLTTSGSSDTAVFGTPPVFWCTSPDSTTLQVEPAAFAYELTSATALEFQDVNKEPRGAQTSYAFAVNASYDGMTYCSKDPTIINVGPSGPNQRTTHEHTTVTK
jgi:hypothetical protein